MAKRFIDTDKHRMEHRGLDIKIRFAIDWLWKNCDAAGIWPVDASLFKFECGYALNLDAVLKACPTLRKLPDGALFFTDFVGTNYGTLKEGYNPHKPVFRSLQLHGIDPLTMLFQGLDKPYIRLEEEGEGEEEGEEEKGGGTGEPKPPQPRKSPDTRIDQCIEYFTEKAGHKPADASKWLRVHVSNLLRWAAEKDNDKDRDPVMNVQALIDAALTLDFHRSNATTFRYLYEYRETIYKTFKNGSPTSKGASVTPDQAARKTAEYFARKRGSKPPEPAGDPEPASPDPAGVTA